MNKERTGDQHKPPVVEETSTAPLSVGDRVVIDKQGLGKLVELLKAKGYRVIGPSLRDGAVVYDELNSIEELPAGWTDEQEAGRYRLKRRADGALFGYAVGPHSWKQFLYPPRTLLWRAERKDGGFVVQGGTEEPARFAFLGVRSCELHAIAVQDRVFLEGHHSDPRYRARRTELFTVAVNCGQAGGTCFCVSMATGPRSVSGFDIALTEVIEDGRHYFVAETGSASGTDLLSGVPHAPAAAQELGRADEVVARTAASMGRSLDTTDIRGLLYRNAEHPRWEDVASRCLTCGNCTLVCPTCFCSTVEDVTDLKGNRAERWRSWDSCFTMDFSYIHGGSVRSSTKSRYRQWMTHKLATWIDQFGTSGCVGCGRCITWCPVGIDITEETRAIRKDDGGGKDGDTNP